MTAREENLTLDHSASVFINCPFDLEYRPLLEGIIVATVCCGFTPRSALESGSVSETRIDRIVETLCSSNYSIHDLSRHKGEGTENLSRFNMPLELGMAMAHRFLLGKDKHDWMVMVPEGHKYIQYASDLAGYDPLRHDGSIESAVSNVVSWLITKPGVVQGITPKQVIAYQHYQKEKKMLSQKWIQEEQIPWK
ncbi:MAG TPA: hypothetical protein PLI09_13005 [Candidatus Hydrogenedentes bacterium]|nr:hypothetical protein [Candidatus Hydrogenedentota bacterium]